MNQKKSIVIEKTIQERIDASIPYIPDAVHHGTASSNYLTWKNIVPDITVKNTYDSETYYHFREDEEIPTHPKGIMCMGLGFYKKNPIVRNTIDMMSEFASNGMVIAHRSEKIQDFYTLWLKKIKYYTVNERFANNLFKLGTVAVNRTFTKINQKQINEIYAGTADTIAFPKIDWVKSEIPISYSFLNPLYIYMPDEELSLFSGKYRIMLILPEHLIRRVKKMDKKTLDAFLEELPPDVVKVLRKGDNKLPLENRNVTLFHYKKDDWETWGEPIHACILDDLIHYEKTRLADRTTLDSIASRIRLWKLGHLEKDNSILPNEAAFEKLNDILASIPSGGVADIVWSPAISVEELSKDAWQFLGAEKYKAPLNAIYQGLGVPRTINDDGGFNNSYFGLKTLVERLNYARNLLKQFWSEEFKVIHKALSLPGDPPEIYFDEISVTNKENMLKLMMDLSDRNLLSDEEVRRMFNTIPDIEKYRVRKENKRKKNEMDPVKAGPYHNSNLKGDLQKVALNKELITPEDAGLESSLDTKKVLDQRNKAQIQKSKIVGGTSGRPLNSKDKQKRTRQTKPRSSMAYIYYNNAQNIIHNFLLSHKLKEANKKNARQLSTAQTENLESDKLKILLGLGYGVEVTEEFVKAGVNKSVSQEDLQQYNSMLGEFVEQFGRQPNTDEVRSIQVGLCVERLNENNNEL